MGPGVGSLRGGGGGWALAPPGGGVWPGSQLGPKCGGQVLFPAVGAPAVDDVLGSPDGSAPVE